MADRTHGGNHAPLLNGGWLKPGFCAGCDAERAGEALGSIVHVTHVAADSEEYARIFNEGYEAAMAQHLADDPSAADDWLAAHTAAAKREGARAVVEAVEAEGHKHLGSNPFSVKVAMLDAAREAAARVGSPEVCSTCGGAFDSPPCSLNREIGWSGHTRSGGAATGTRVEGGA